MKPIKWFGVLTLLGASTVAAVPAWALSCWTPSLLAPISYVPAIEGSYVDCNGTNLHAEASVVKFGGSRNITVSRISGDQAKAWGFDSNRNFIPGCFVESPGIANKTCTADIKFFQLEATDNN
jgi:hypothetical protein